MNDADVTCMIENMGFRERGKEREVDYAVRHYLPGLRRR